MTLLLLFFSATIFVLPRGSKYTIRIPCLSPTLLTSPINRKHLRAIWCVRWREGNSHYSFILIPHPKCSDFEDKTGAIVVVQVENGHHT
jgi:hypothetical protein